jgi:hypothetical protein
MPGLDTAFLLDRLARLPGGDPPQVYELGRINEPPSAEGVAGVVARSFVPETLRSQLVRLLRGGEAPEHGVLGWASSLKGEMRTALFQALGMLTGAEPEEVLEPPAKSPGGAFGWIGIDADDGDFTMRLEIESGRDLPRSLMSTMLGREPDGEGEGSEPALDAIQEILNVVAGRLKSSCLERKIQVSIGRPATGFEAPPPRTAQFEHQEWFRWSECEPFRVRFDASPCRESVAPS